MDNELDYEPLLGERSESLSGEAPQAMPAEGVLNPINSRYCVTDASVRAL
jgi:hypothetical protein